MPTILDHFKTLTKIPHCSKKSDALMHYLKKFSEERGYQVEIDKAKNIYIHKGHSALCLQAHYDMVCMGDAPTIETYEEKGWLKAKNASLGADNGMAIAMMMHLMDAGEALEFLLTSDEEIGLIGANALSFDLQSKYMLNLDSEDEAEVYIGCAGGVDIVACKKVEMVECKENFYEVSVKNLPGGHSGVDIDKDIPSAIKVLVNYLDRNNVTKLSSFFGGERRNSIPVNAKAIVASNISLNEDTHIEVKMLERKYKILKEGEVFFETIQKFKDGVRAHNNEFDIPDVSINLAIVSADERNGIGIECSARAMSVNGLEKLTEETVSFFKQYGLEVTVEDKYPAWKPDISSFTHLVNTEMKKEFGGSKLMAIHAGLECGVIAEKYPEMKFASIGPTIRYPHSTREKVNLLSVERMHRVLLGIVGEINNL